MIFAVFRILLDFVKELAVFLAEDCAIQQIGAVSKRFCQGRVSAPAADFFVVAGNQDFWNGNTPELGRASEMRVVEQPTGGASGIGGRRRV